MKEERGQEPGAGEEKKKEEGEVDEDGDVLMRDAPAQPAGGIQRPEREGVLAPVPTRLSKAQLQRRRRNAKKRFARLRNHDWQAGVVSVM